jgi:hypothetical protein
MQITQNGIRWNTVRTIGVAEKAIHFERRRSESAHDELAVSIGRTVEVGLARRSHVIAADEQFFGSVLKLR